MARKRRQGRKPRAAGARRRTATAARSGRPAGRAAADAESLHALGQFAGGAAHHLNNLLTIVVGRVQLLLRSATDERVRRSLESVERASKDAAEVVRRLHQFARMRRVEQPRMVDLNTIAAEVIESTRPRWQDDTKAAGVTIDVERRFRNVPAVPGDPAALREALTSVVHNAVDAMPKGGRILVETTRESGKVAVSVADNGTGMTADVKRRAREPFFTTKGVKATGLGLSVAYGVVRRHGGDLVMKSTAGRGTRVIFRLPIAPLAVRGRGRRSTSLRILLVDHEADARDRLAEILMRKGHVVVTAGSAETALSRVQSQPGLDVVLTDGGMPGMTGSQIAAAVKARRPRLAVGVMTAAAAGGDPGQAGSADFVLRKPLSMAAVDAALARLKR
jgi:CheY-like chemotaxis protein/two-component sensor histidine kinase